MVTHNDAHASEYIAEHDERLAFVSKFTGSAGTALITMDKALLWTDGRYFTQATNELHQPWELMKSGEKDVPSLETYLSTMASAYCPPADTAGDETTAAAKKPRRLFTVGVDSETSTIKACERIQNASEALDILLLHPSFIDEIWEKSKSRPKPIRKKVFLLPDSATGRNVKAKIDAVVSQLKAKSCDAMVISALDDIAWLLNARSSEIPFNPVFFAHLVISEDSACTVYTDHGFDEYNGVVTVKPYLAFLRDTDKLFAHCQKIWIDPSTTSMAFLWSCLGRKKDTFKEVLAGTKSKLHQANTCVKLDKPKKSPEEIQAMKQAQISDGVAVTRFLSYLSRVNVETTNHDEHTLAGVLEAFRVGEDSAYAGNSFETISAYGENGAVVHYKPKEVGSKKIRGSNVYLCDSGGHYSYGGTTDTTRTVWLGSDKSSLLYNDAKRCYTYVLKAHVALADAQFPSGLTAARLDAIPRAELWKAGLDYNHGTGHGVGSYLCVHELPPLISSVDVGMGGLSSTMCVTNEPGYYEEGKFGFRIENLMFAVEVEGNPKYCKFETITLVPYCRDLIDVTLLTDRERMWINEYHMMCRKTLSPRLQSATEDLAWLQKETEAI